ncbi:helicase-exonuclease AddAB subunit AddA [Ruminococcus sp. Marseille-P6503]|uniref:helicase-exonuclease AddAB subunit AddA n=1 Tax=Ruminococcus sp. Marseille-P6503 TaxID=2364796 RepID=UPI000F5281AB|nr:helicase-exonuclease AddAB subunit AddA [Ruminococcus sp. Marseille-P6503]
MSVKWTEDQRTAIETYDKGVVVSAAAGSGKTAVLIERTINLLADRSKNIPADRLLAVTFTVDATAQMKEKLAAAFDKKILEETDPAQKKWLQKQQDRLALARINTINAFCLELVRSNIHEFELQDGIKILDETDSEVILKNSIAAAMDKLAQESPEEYDFLVDSLSDGSEQAVEKIAAKLYDFLRSLPFPDEWIREKTEDFTSDERLSDYVSTAVYDYREMLERALKLNEAAKSAFYRLHEKYGCKETAGEALDSDRELLEEFLKTLDNGSWEEIYSFAESAVWKRLTVSFPKGDIPPVQLEERSIGAEQIKKLRESCKDCVKRIRTSCRRTGLHIKEDLLIAKRIFTDLCGLCKSAEEISWSEKVSRNSLEFSDVERMAINLLVRREDGKTVRTELAEEIVKNRDYQVILIDEFQDVNNLQELIFKALSDTEDLSALGRNVFVVGDVKQSIYRFRQSNPQLFINAREQAAAFENGGILKSVALKKNFRSRKNIIDFVNLVFENLMSEEVGELVYSGDERLQYGAQYGGRDHDTEIILAELPADKADAADSDEDEYVLFTEENYIIAKRIRQLIDEGCCVYSGDEKRPCRPSDFCVLSRSKSATEKLSAALGAVGLKAYSEETSGYLRAREIAVMINLLRVIDNPMQDMAMASVMMSPVLSFTADETAVLRRLCNTGKGYTKHIYQIINAAGKEEGSHEREAEKLDIGDAVIEKKCRYALELIKRLRFYAAGMPLSRLIRKIYDETGFFAVASAYENSRQKRANLRLLLEYAASYENSGEGGVTGFIRYLDSVYESGKDFRQAVTVTEGKDSVYVKTIHKSKGLEYPFVFLCGIDKEFNLSDINQKMLLDEQLGAGFTILNHSSLTQTETISHKALSVIGRNKTLSEEIRLLYVALTRAKEKLFIPIMIRESKNGRYDTRRLVNNIAEEISRAGGISSRIVRQCGSYLEWLCAVLLCCPGNEAFLEKMEVSAELPKFETQASVSFVTAECTDSDKILDHKFINPCCDEKLVSELCGRYSFKYLYGNADTPSKLTVTEIVREEKEREYGERNPEFYPQLPRLSDEIGKLSSAQKGTCTHLFMELADYSRACEDAEGELARLVREGYFTPKEADGVYIEAVKHFFAGGFYKRMSAGSELIREKQFLVSFSDLRLDKKYEKYAAAGTMLQGVADCIFRESDGYVLVDYKTDNFRDVSELYEYRTQLELYKAALDLLLDMPVKACYIYSFRLNNGVEINLNLD